MIVNLHNVSHVTITSMRFELHFTNGGSHMQRFDSVAEMLAEIHAWQEKTDDLSLERLSGPQQPAKGGN